MSFGLLLSLLASASAHPEAPNDAPRQCPFLNLRGQDWSVAANFPPVCDEALSPAVIFELSRRVESSPLLGLEQVTKSQIDQILKSRSYLKPFANQSTSVCSLETLLTTTCNANESPLIDSQRWLLVCFFAMHCPFSRALLPRLLALSHLFPTLRIVVFDAWTDTSINLRYGVRGFPSLLLFQYNDYNARYHGAIDSLSALQNFVTRRTQLRPVLNTTTIEPLVTHLLAQPNVQSFIRSPLALDPLVLASGACVLFWICYLALTSLLTLVPRLLRPLKEALRRCGEPLTRILWFKSGFVILVGIGLRAVFTRRWTSRALRLWW